MSTGTDFEQLGFTESEDTGAAPPDAPGQVRKRRKLAAWLTAIASVLIGIILIGAIAILIGLGVAPDKTKEVIGTAGTQIKHQAQVVSGQTPRVILGPDGGQELVDQCPGSWVRMVDYQTDEMQSPVYSAHNGCWGEGVRGDVILPLGIGDVVEVVERDGGEQEFRIVEMLDVPQFTTTVDDISHLSGTLILQTCYWDGATMKFVMLEPVQ
ncbi:hypothetical protein EDF62_3259 [Leucobacter luti]|uniref:Sortase family protein n=1 Tax=Leucobacter luti TaxID=340320 RepID=A0A4V3CXA8_9MICO|nr:hypothetical protein [Leucobacter luti]TDP89528.1 hypothetical protein EDF62_3259 [Leucobacter luti]